MRSFIRWMTFLSLLSSPALARHELAAYDRPVARNSGPYAWSNEDYQGYGRFMQAIGQEVAAKRCGTLDSCIKNSKHPEIAAVRRGLSGGKEDPAFLNRVRFYADCGDFHKVSEALYGFSRGLPVAYRSRVEAVNPAEKDKDLRYTAKGNVIPKDGMRVALPSQSSSLMTEDVDQSGNRVWRFAGKITDQIGTVHYRTNPLEEAHTDLYSTELSQIRPGTVLYDPNGHMGIVSHVDKNGRVHYVDAHPDGSLTTGTFNADWENFGRIALGGGFRNARPFQLQTDETGQPRARFLEKPRHFSLEQHQFIQSPDGKNVLWRTPDGKAVSMSKTDYIKLKLGATIDPLEDLRQDLRDICGGVKARMEAVEAARRAGIHRQKHARTIPKTIAVADATYEDDQTRQVWDKYSTPGRDSRLKIKLQAVVNSIDKYIGFNEAKFERLSFQGDRGTLVKKLTQVLDEEDKKCAAGSDLGYIKSDGSFHQLTLLDVMNRIYDMSFDPYHCPERRWGAVKGRHDRELVTCKDDAEKTAWYEAQAGIRKNIRRPASTDEHMTLEKLIELMKSGKAYEIKYAARHAPSLNLYEKLDRQRLGQQ